MAPSSERSRGVRRSVRIVALLVGLVIPACAQVTGLSDDYRYDLDAASPGSGGDASSGDAAAREASDDARDDARGGQCGPVERARASTEIDNANGDDLPVGCQTCLSSNCCRPIDLCANTSDCSQAMRCVFQCQRTSGGGNSKAQCLASCRPAFQQTVGGCVATSCSGVCQLGS